MVHRYKIADANKFIVKTGIGIEGATIHKKTFHWPFQTATTLDMTPRPYHIVIDKAMSREKIAFKMPIAFTVGPFDKPEALNNLVTKILGIDEAKFNDLVFVAVAGACRRQAGTLDLEHIFSDRTKFRDQVIEIINKELLQFGLHIFTMNIEELEDMEGNEYFKYLRRRALEGAINMAKIDVAEKQKEGDVGQKMHQGETRRQLAEIEKDAKLVENIRDIEISKSNTEMNVAKAEYDRAVKVAQLEAEANAEKRRFELQREVEEFRKSQETERLRASELSVANVNAEVAIRKADAEAEARIRLAKGEAESIRLLAEAKLQSQQNEAKGIQAVKEAEAKGIQALREAEAIGLERLVSSAGGVNGLTNYLLVKDEVLQKIAQHNANAVSGLKPQITIWNTGKQDGESNALTGTIKDIINTGVPLLEGLKAQTGIDILGRLKNQSSPDPTPKV
jgi:flotillin